MAAPDRNDDRPAAVTVTSPDTPPARPASRLRPFGGWAFQVAWELEERSGIRLILPLFGASDLRRAAAFLALAAWCAPSPEQRILLAGISQEEYAHWLLTEDPAEIAELLDPSRRDPRRLARIGEAPLPQAAFYRLFAA